MKTKNLPYRQNLLDFIQQSGEKLHDLRCVVYIYGSLRPHEYTKSRTISGLQIHKVYEFTPLHLKN